MFEMFVCSLELFALRRGRPERRGLVRREHRELCSPKFVCSPEWFAMFARSGVVRHSPVSQRLTLGADKAYDVFEFVDTCATSTSRRTSPRTRPIAAPRSMSERLPPRLRNQPAESAASLGRRYAARRADASSSL
jgi:hypothetical protein